MGLARPQSMFRPMRLAETRSVTTGARALTPETRTLLRQILAAEDVATQSRAPNNNDSINHYRLEFGGLVNHDIFWGDMDTFGHVNNVMYLKWFETGKNFVVLFSKKKKKYQDKKEGILFGILLITNKKKYFD
jgi:hypothetical protein